MQQEQHIRRGYLHEDFRLFHIRDRKELEVEYHYHAFDKIVVFLSGRVTYLMEGKSYFLRPWDVLLVSHDQIHKPLIDTSEPYERIILWASPAFLQRHKGADYDLARCFDLARQRNFALLRLAPHPRQQVMELLRQTEEALDSKEFAASLQANTSFLQFLICINRLIVPDQTAMDRGAYQSDDKIEEILAYIQTHLDGILTVDELARQFYLSPSYLMHRFKAVTGYTVHRYVQQKRLMQSTRLLQQGMAASQVALTCGFSDYSTFVRAFKRMFDLSPREFAGR